MSVSKPESVIVASGLTFLKDYHNVFMPLAFGISLASIITGLLCQSLERNVPQKSRTCSDMAEIVTESAKAGLMTYFWPITTVVHLAKAKSS